MMDKLENEETPDKWMRNVFERHNGETSWLHGYYTTKNNKWKSSKGKARKQYMHWVKKEAGVGSYHSTIRNF